MKKVKRFLTALLCVCALAALTAIAASASGEQEAHIALDDTPQIGREAPKKASSYIISDFVVKRVDWVGELDSGKFKANTKYTALLTLTLRDSSKSIDPDNFIAYVNNQFIKEAYQEVDNEIIVPVEFEPITPVEEVRITLTAPVTGKIPAATAKVPSDAKYEVKKVEWKGTLSGGKFKENTEYTANITLGIKSGTNAGFDDKDFPVYINDQLIDEVTWNSGVEIVVPAVFSKTAAATTTPTSVKKVEITLTPPETGKTPASKATVSSSAPYYVKDLVWTKGDLSTGKFVANTEYTAEVTLGIKSGENAVFADKNFEAYVNKYLIDEITWNSKTEIVVPVTFEKTPAATQASTAIDKIQLTLDAPAWGKTPATTATVPSTAHTTVKSVKWSGQLDTDGTFMPRVKYTATITMGIKSGANYYFSDKANSLTVTVNGKSADAYWHSNTEVEVVYTFDAAATSSTITLAYITIDGPAAGEKPATTAHIASTASTYIKSVSWEGALDSAGRFQAGKEYTAYITLAMKDNDRKFSTSVFDATVNGVLIDAATLTRVSDKELIIPVSFEKTPGTAPGTSPSKKPTVVPTSQKLTVDGAAKNTEIYNIDDSNYFKLRDIAALLTGTGSQFSVDYDAARSTIVVKTGKAYAFVGGELVTGTDKSASATASAQSIEIDGKKVDLTAYNIGGNNFFKLRDLGKALNFDVDYDSGTATMIVKSR